MNSSSVLNMFENIAKSYDLMNNVMTFGTHSVIKSIAISRLPISQKSTILDLCTGTGDIAIHIARRYKCKKVIGVDFSNNMLELAREKAKNLPNVEFMQADVLSLPFADNEFDASFISFGLRNVSNIEVCLQEMMRVTKDGGHVSNLDLGKPHKFFNTFFAPYFFKLVPILGKLIHGSSAPYKYLPESNKAFPSQDELVKLLSEIGCVDSKNYDYLFGAIAQQVGIVRK